MEFLRIFLCLLFLMFSGSSSEMPIYRDEEGEKKIKLMTERNESLRKAYAETQERKDVWVSEMMEDKLSTPNNDSKYKLGSIYNTVDMFVKKTNQSDIQVIGGTTRSMFFPIKREEMKRMGKRYKTVHLDGFYINCQSLMPPGSEGFAIVSLYDTRFIDLTKGFLGLIGFPLSKRSSTATLRVNYPISTTEENNWVAIITVHDHNLRDNSKPCNFHIETFYKYTNNLDRFTKFENESEVGKFKIPITADPHGFAIESVRNSLDYSVSVLSNKHFMNNLSKKEIQSLNILNDRWKAMSQREIAISGSSMNIEEIRTKENKIESDFANLTLDCKGKGKEKVKENEEVIDFGRASSANIADVAVSFDGNVMSIPGLPRSFSTK